MDPPWKEYAKRTQGMINLDDNQFVPWEIEEIANIPIEKLSSTPTFLFLWCGADHLLDARSLFKKWGFKRCEDVVWCKTNKKNKALTNI